MKTNSLEEADLIIQKLPSDMGIHRIDRKGTLKAPEKILDGFEFDEKVLVDEVFPDEFDLENNHKRIESSTRDLLEYGKPVLSVGGDHSVSFGVLKALKRKNPALKLVWLDAHLDLKEKVEENISHDVVVRELLDNGFSEDEIWFVGVTEVDEDEKEFIEDSELHIYRSDEVDEFLEDFNSDGSIYLSADIDVLRSDEVPGTGYPDGELSFDQVESVIEHVEPDFADLVEVAPPLDENGKTVENARRLIQLLSEEILS